MTDRIHRLALLVMAWGFLIAAAAGVEPRACVVMALATLVVSLPPWGR